MIVLIMASLYERPLRFKATGDELAHDIDGTVFFMAIFAT